MSPRRCRRTGKVRWRDHREAIGALHSATAARALGDRRRREARSYRCPACGGWHLTSLEAAA